MSPGEATPHLWAHGAAMEEFERARPLLLALLRHHPRYRLLLTATDDALRHRLRARFPEATVGAPPGPSSWRVRRTFGRLRPHVLLLLERPHDLGRPVFDRARWWRFPVILLDGAAPELQGAPAPLLRAVDHFLLRDPAAAPMLRARGIAAEAITVATAAPASGAGPPAAAGWAAPLGALLARDWARLGTPRPRGLGGWAPRALASRLGRLALGLRARRIETLAALRDQLGAPGTILCLGNGPSSEDSRLSTVRWDVLFRVNCRWAGRGGYDRPHVVFTGDTECLGAADVLAFRTVEEECRLLGRHLLCPRPWRLSYLTVERLPVPLATTWARPTNGAVMVVTAAALAPRRLVIAGIDLFAHPAGAYPGDAATPNAYLLMHDREAELDVLERALRAFSGDLVVLSEPLARALERRGVPGAVVEAGAG